MTGQEAGNGGGDNGGGNTGTPTVATIPEIRGGLSALGALQQSMGR